MSIEIDLWLQEEISEYAQELACQRIATKHGVPTRSVYASDEEDYYGERNNPRSGSFHYRVRSYSYLKHNIADFIELSIREVLKHYVLSQET